MSVRTNILAALRSDFNVTGMQKSWKRVERLDQISDDSLPSFSVKLGTAVAKYTPEGTKIWELPVLCIIYFQAGTDTTNQGLLETAGEALIDKYDAITNYTALKLVEEVISIEMISITPYVDTEINHRGFIFLEYKIEYIGA